MSYHNTAGEVRPLLLYKPFCKYTADHRKRLVLVSLIAGPFRQGNLKYDSDADREGINHSFYAFYSSVSQPPGRGPVPGPRINYTAPREILLELITNLNVYYVYWAVHHLDS